MRATSTIVKRFKALPRFMILVLLVSGMPGQTYSQKYHTCCDELLNDEFKGMPALYALDYTPKPPYAEKQLYNTWTRGSITFDNGRVVTGILLAYNAWLDELLWLNESNYLTGVIPKQHIYEFSFQTRGYQGSQRFRKVRSEGNPSGHVYFQVINEGLFTVYCQRRYTYIASRRDFDVSSHYFLETNGHLRPFRPNRRSVIALFPKEERPRVRQALSKGFPLLFWREQDIKRFFQIVEGD